MALSELCNLSGIERQYDHIVGLAESMADVDEMSVKCTPRFFKQMSRHPVFIRSRFDWMINLVIDHDFDYDTQEAGDVTTENIYIVPVVA